LGHGPGCFRTAGPLLCFEPPHRITVSGDRGDDGLSGQRPLATSCAHRRGLQEVPDAAAGRALLSVPDLSHDNDDDIDSILESFTGDEAAAQPFDDDPEPATWAWDPPPSKSRWRLPLPGRQPAALAFAVFSVAVVLASWAHDHPPARPTAHTPATTTAAGSVPTRPARGRRVGPRPTHPSGRRHRTAAPVRGKSAARSTTPTPTPTPRAAPTPAAPSRYAAVPAPSGSHFTDEFTP
jgi:hypothetical protein